MAWSLNPVQRIQRGRQVLLFNSRVKLFGEGKLRSKWQGPYTVINTSPHGAITIQDDDGNIFKVNDQRLKVLLEPSYNSNLEIDRIELLLLIKLFKTCENLKKLTMLTYSFIYLKYKKLLYLLKQVMVKWPLCPQ